MEQIKSILQKIELTTASAGTFSALERDLLLQYTRELYEAILKTELKNDPVAENKSILTEEPELMPEPQEEEEAKEIVVGNTVNDIEETQQLTEEPEEDFAYKIEEKEKEPEAFDDDVYDDALYTNVVKKEEIVETADALASEEIQKLTDNDDEAIDEDDEKEEAEPEGENEPEEIETEEKESLSSIEETQAEKMNFELEPELKNETPIFSSRLTDFKVWNRDIRAYIGINDKYNFISELFQHNNEAYDEILNEINHCENKEDALSFLENSGITTLYKWKEEGFSEQIFYNILSQFFASK